MAEARLISELGQSLVHKGHSALVTRNERLASTDAQDLRDLGRAVGIQISERDELKEHNKKSILFLIDTITRLGVKEPTKGSTDAKYQEWARANPNYYWIINSVGQLGAEVRKFLSGFQGEANQKNMEEYVARNLKDDQLPLIVRKLAEATGFTDGVNGKAAIERVLRILKYKFEKNLDTETINNLNNTIERIHLETAKSPKLKEQGCLVAMVMVPITAAMGLYRSMTKVLI